MKKTTLSVITVLIAIGLPRPLVAQSDQDRHAHGNGEGHHDHNESRQADTSAGKVKLVTGQGGFCFFMGSGAYCRVSKRCYRVRA